MLQTESHKAAADALFRMGLYFFSGEVVLPRVQTRLYPLVIGPTGVGKSYLVERTASRLGAAYFRVTRGDWLVTGSRADRCTMFQVLDRLLANERLVIHIDELDKFDRLQGAGEWAASIASDLWNLLDKRFQTALYLAETKFADGESATEAQLRAKIRHCLWIVGSGTWQDVFEGARPGSRIGFASSAGDTVDKRSIAGSRSISPELLHRFNGDTILLTYPDPEETELLLISSGIEALARKLGIRVSAADIDWTQGGMRSLETLATRLSLIHFERKGCRQATPARATGNRGID